MLFDLLLKNKLIFNTCWEDPKIDRKLFQINQNSNILTITSAGCNAIEYLLDNPKKVFCCDINPAQNSVLELKIALFKNGDYNLLWSFFGLGKINDAEEIYKSKLKVYLSDNAQSYWDNNIHYFDSKVTYYRRGASGRASQILISYLKSNKKLYSAIKEIFQANSLDEQEQIYERVEERLWNKFTKILLDNYLIHYLLGVPRNQYRVSKLNDSSLYKYLQKNLKVVFTEYPTIENHFWKVYIQGHYDDRAKPEYLMEHNFENLKSKIDRISVNYCPLQDIFEKENITHINLLDHQDWHIGKSNYIIELWEKILEKESLEHVLMRTASPTFGLPEYIEEKFSFTDKSEIEVGRVGTYYEAIHAIKKL